MKNKRISPKKLIKDENTVETYFVIKTTEKTQIYKKYKAIFESNNKLYKYLKAKCKSINRTLLAEPIIKLKITEISTALYIIPEPTIVRSTAVKIDS